MWSLMWMWWCKRVNKLWNWRIGRRTFSIYSFFFYKTCRLKIPHLNKSAIVVLSIFILPTYLKKYLTRAHSIINFHVVTSCAAKTDWKSIAKICPPTICRMLYSQFWSCELRCTNSPIIIITRNKKLRTKKQNLSHFWIVRPDFDNTPRRLVGSTYYYTRFTHEQDHKIVIQTLMHISRSLHFLCKTQNVQKYPTYVCLNIYWKWLLLYPCMILSCWYKNKVIKYCN